MRLLIVASEFPPGPGGIGTHAWQIGSQLVALGWDVTVVTPQDYASAAEIRAFNAAQPLRIVGLRRIPGPPLEAVYRYRVAARILRDWRPDAILASGERAVWLSSRLVTIRKTPWIAVGHGTEFGTSRRLERALTRSAYEGADAVVCVSEYTRSRMHRAGIHGRREVVIPNGADPTVFEPRSANGDQVPASGAVLLTVGHLSERKGQDLVIRALPSLPGVRYEMIGLPTKARELTALAQQLGVSDRVQILGRVSQDELVRRMNSCDLFVMTSRNTMTGDFEGYGIAVVEAALCGKPAVVTEGSGLAEAIIAGETGLLAREGDVASTARTIREVLDDRGRRERMGRAARARALREQTWEMRAARYDVLLRELLRPKGRRLVVISDTPHYRRAGVIVGWGATVRELDQLSSLFDEVVHVAPVSEGSAPANSLPYESSRVRLRELPMAGGDRIADKIQLLRRLPTYLRIATQELNAADVVHVRCPASVSMVVAMLLPFRRRPARRWIKYAGDWNPSGDEPWTYELQRRWLRTRFHRALVTVNGDWPGQPPHVRSFANPCLTDAELESAQLSTGRKAFGYPVKLLFVGRLEEAKGISSTAELFIRLSKRGYAVHLDLVGDGPARSSLERVLRDQGLEKQATFHGWLPHALLGARYAEAHLNILPSWSEGWPKVLSEGMAYGVVPIASRVSSIPQYLLRFGIGSVADPGDIEGFERAVVAYVNSPERWHRESKLARQAAKEFSYSLYLRRVVDLLSLDPLERVEGS